MSLFKELSRRNVIRVAVAYVLASWVIAQVADLVLESIGAPDWVMQSILLVLALGFPLVLIFSWAFEVTPDGIKRESEVDRSHSITSVTGRKLNTLITTLLVIALAYFAWDSQRRVPESTVAATDSGPASLSIAVLPFDNRSNREEDQFFTDGMHDDLLTTIAKIGSMKVISRTSVMEYKGTTKKIPEIARELGVANILEGGVQRAGNHVRINMQLIDANTDEHLWAEIYDRELTAENLFAIQSEISNAIANALHATLSPEEQERIDSVPTTNLEAYEAYLRARQLMETRVSKNLEQAMKLYERAVELDPEFALAWSGIADTYAHLVNYAGYSREETNEARKLAVDKALELAPDSGQVYTSLGGFLFDIGEFEDGEAALKRATELSPNYATSLHWLSNNLRQDRSRTRESLQYAEKSRELDPRSGIIGANLAGTYNAMGMHDEAIAEARRVLEFSPDFAEVLSSYAGALAQRGDLADSLVMAKRRAASDPGNPWASYFVAITLMSLHAWDAAEEVTDAMESRFGSSLQVRIARAEMAIARGQPEVTRALVHTETGTTGYDDLEMYLASLLALAGDADGALATATALLEDGDASDLAAWDRLIRSSAAQICLLSDVLVARGDADLGQQLAREALRYIDNVLASQDRHADNYGAEWCYLAQGERGKALDILETNLEHGHIGHWSVGLVKEFESRLGPNPRLHGIISRYEKKIAAERRKAGLDRAAGAPT